MSAAPPTSGTADLQDAYLRLQVKQTAADRAARAARLAAENLANTATKAEAPTLPHTATGHGFGGLPRPPLWRLVMLALVSCLLLLTACGGGGGECADGATATGAPPSFAVGDGSEPLPPACVEPEPDPSRTPAPQPPACQANPELCR